MPSISQRMMEKPAPKILATAGDKVQTTNLSIKKMLSPDSETGDTTSSNYADMPREAFHFDELKMAWRQFANEMKQEGKETFYNAMIKRNPKQLTDTSYIFEVDNKVQVDMISNDVEKLISFIRSSVKNYDVMIEVKMTDNVQEDVKHLTGKDKFAMLSRKFPNLHALKDTFNLEIDY